LVQKALVFVGCLALAGSAYIPFGTSASEGFFLSQDVKTPFNEAGVLRSLARVSENIYWDTIVLNTKADADTLKTSFRLYRGTGRKTYLPQGAVLWHIVLTKADLLQMTEDPASAYEARLNNLPPCPSVPIRARPPERGCRNRHRCRRRRQARTKRGAELTYLIGG
jgi:hypothetical protein